MIKEGQENQKTYNWLKGSDPKEILAEMMLDSSSQIKVRNDVLITVINKAKARISDIKKSETINKTTDGVPDGARGENYKIVGGERIPDSLVPLHESIIGRSFTFESLKNNAELYAEAYLP